MKNVFLFIISVVFLFPVRAQEVQTMGNSMNSSAQLVQDSFGDYALLYSLEEDAGKGIEAVRIPQDKLESIYTQIKELLQEEDEDIYRIELGEFEAEDREGPLQFEVVKETDLVNVASVRFSLQNEEYDTWKSANSYVLDDIEALFLPASDGLSYIGQYGISNYWKIPLLEFKKSRSGETGNFRFLPSIQAECMTFDSEQYKFIQTEPDCSGKATMWFPNFLQNRDPDYTYKLGFDFKLVFTPAKADNPFPVQMMLGNSPKGYYYVAINDKGQVLVGVRNSEEFRDVWVSSEDLIKWHQKNEISFQFLQDGMFAIQVNDLETSTEQLFKESEGASKDEFTLGDMPGISNRLLTYAPMKIEHLYLGQMEFPDTEDQLLDPFNGLSKKTLEMYGRRMAEQQYKDRGEVVYTEVIETRFTDVNILGEKQIMVVSVIDVEVEGDAGRLQDQFSLTYQISDFERNTVDSVILKEKGADGNMKIWDGKDFFNEVLSGKMELPGFIHADDFHTPESRFL